MVSRFTMSLLQGVPSIGGPVFAVIGSSVWPVRAVSAFTSLAQVVEELSSSRCDQATNEAIAEVTLVTTSDCIDCGEEKKGVDK